MDADGGAGRGQDVVDQQVRQVELAGVVVDFDPVAVVRVRVHLQPLDSGPRDLGVEKIVGAAVGGGDDPGPRALDPVVALAVPSRYLVGPGHGQGDEASGVGGVAGDRGRRRNVERVVVVDDPGEPSINDRQVGVPQM